MPVVVGALLAAGLGLTPSVTAAALAVVSGVGSMVTAVTGPAGLRSGARVDRLLCSVALLIAVAAVGLGGSTLWHATELTATAAE